MDSGVAVIEFNGDVTLGQGAGLLRDTIFHELEQGQKKILVDLEEVSYIDSAGLGELVGCRSLAGKNGAEIKLVHLQKRVKGLLQITKLITIFETFDDEYKAVRSFQQTNSAPI